MIKKKIAITSYWPLPAELLAKISVAAPQYELLDLAASPTDKQLADCEILFGNAGATTVRRMPNVKWIHAQTAGVESYLDPNMGLSDEVLLTNSSGAYGIPIAEHMLTFSLMLLRNAGTYLSQQREHIWRNAGTVRCMRNCQVTVVGLGDIGGRYAYLCNAMGAMVNGVVRSPRVNIPSYVEKLYTVEHLDEAIQHADIVALALPGTSETTGLLSRERLLNMKKGALVINIGRGSAIDQNALIELLQSGHIGGAALDVTTPEPLPAENPLWDMSNVIITPHISHGGRENTSDFVVDKFVRYLKDYINGRAFERVVDRGAGY